METTSPGEAAAAPERMADVLLVEDDASDAELTIRALKQSGLSLRIEHVEDGEEALDYIASTNLFVRRHAPASLKLVLLDLKLNRIGGLHVLRQLKSDDRTKGIPIVVLTASRLAIEVVESYQLGVNSYVIKPTDSTKFAETIVKIAQYWLALNEPPPL